MFAPVQSRMSVKKDKTRMRSPIWHLFTLDPLDSCKAICVICQSSIRRGGTRTDSMCTTNLWNHVRHRHPDVCNKLEMKSMSSLVAMKSSENSQKKRDAFTSEILKLYDLPDDNSTMAKCLECQQGVFCGVGCSNPSSLKAHTKLRHPGSFWIAGQQTISEKKPARSSTQRNLHKTSSIWDDFDKDPTNPCQAICKTCNTVVKRGSSAVHLNTTNLHRHLESSFHVHVERLIKKQAANPGEELIKVHNGNIDSEEIIFQDLNGESIEDKSIPPLRKIQRKMAESQNPLELVNISQSASFKEQTQITSSVSRILSLGETDVMHTAVIMQAMYEQQKKDCNCDFSLLLSLESGDYNVQSAKVAVYDNGGNVKHYVHENKYEFKLHSCILSVLSDKLNGSIQAGAKSAVVENVHKDAIQSFIEIVYTGKLKGVGSMKKPLLKDVYKIARSLSCPVIMDYLKHEFPKFSFEEESSYMILDRRVNFRSENIGVIENNSFDAPYDDDLDLMNHDDSSKFESVLAKKGFPGVSKVNKRKNYHPKFSDSHKKPRHSDESSESFDEFDNLSVARTNSETDSTGVDQELFFKVFPELIEKNQKDQVVESASKSSQIGPKFTQKNTDIVKSVHIVPYEKKSDSFFRIVNELRLTLDSDIDDCSALDLSSLLRESWTNILQEKLKFATDFQSFKEVYFSVAAISERCWKLFLEVKETPDVPDTWLPWKWIVGLTEEAVYCHLLVFYRNSFHIAEKKIAKHGWMLHHANEMNLSLYFNDKKTQTDSDSSNLSPSICPKLPG